MHTRPDACGQGKQASHQGQQAKKERLDREGELRGYKLVH